MGWWKIKTHDIGDGALDIVDEFFSAMAIEYMEGIGRKPSFAEILLLMQEGLSKNLYSNIKDGDYIEIVELKAKTKKRKKSIKWKVGDILLIPLEDAEHTYAQVTPQGMFLEFFQLRTKRFLRTHEIEKFDRIRFPFLISERVERSRKWKIVDNTKINLKDFKFYLFLVGGLVTSNITAKDERGFIYVDGELRKPLNGETKLLKPTRIYDEGDVIEFLINYRLPLIK